MKSRYVSLRKNPAGSPENKKISYPGKSTRFGKHLFITCLKIEYTLCISLRIPERSCKIVGTVPCEIPNACAISSTRIRLSEYIR